MHIILPCFLPIFTGNLDGSSADSDVVDDGLSDGSTHESNDLQMEGNFPGSWTIGKFGPAILLAIFTVNFADGWIVSL